MEKNMLLIVNPKAGKGTIKKKLPKIIKNFEKKGYQAKTIYTKVDYKPSDILKDNSKEWDLIVCCGGDGTLNELINAVMKLDKKPQIGFIPLGTMNDFARTIRLSTKKTFLAKNIDEGNIIPSDIGTFNNLYFNYVAAFGAFTPVSYVTSHKLKRRFGKFAYFIVAIKYLNKIRGYEITIETEGQTVTDDFIFGSISNSKSVGGFEWFKRSGVKINDGEFECLFIKRPEGIIGYIKTIFAILFKKHSNKKYFEYYQTDKIKITSKAGIPWTIDGEFGGRRKEVEINNINMAIEYVIPM